MGVRVVVTGMGEDGQAKFVSDSVTEPWKPPILPGHEINQVWGADATPFVPNDGKKPSFSDFYAPTNGYRFMVNRIPPANFEAPAPEADEATIAAESEKMLPGLTTEIEDPTGMHETNTIDLEMVVEGTVWLTLVNGEQKEISAGDCIVQNGVGHSWENRHPTEWVTLLIVFIGGAAGR